MEHKMDLQVGLSGPPPGALFSISRDQSDRRATPNSDHQSAIASPSNTEIALKIAKITHSICRRPLFHLDLAATKKFDKWTIGPAAYYIGQLTPDQPSAIFDTALSAAIPVPGGIRG